MAIDLNTGLGPLTQGSRKAGERDANAPARADGTRPGETDSIDSVSISDNANSLRELENRLDASETFDQAKVDSIKRALAEGRYPVDNTRLAEKFLQLENQLNQ